MATDSPAAAKKIASEIEPGIVPGYFDGKVTTLDKIIIGIYREMTACKNMH